MAHRPPGTPLVDLAPGDTFNTRATTVTVLGPIETAPDDRFGRPLLRFWARRADTEAEGWYPFGPRGFVSGY